MTVDRERDLALSAQALDAVAEIDDALAKIALGQVRDLRELRPADREGPPRGAPVRAAVHRLQERGAVAALTGRHRAPSGSPNPDADGRRLAAAVVVAADQITKSLAVSSSPPGRCTSSGRCRSPLAYNTGVAFSIGTGLTLPIIVVGVVLVLLLVWFARGAPSTAAAVGIGMILGGARRQPRRPAVPWPRWRGRRLHPHRLLADVQPRRRVDRLIGCDRASSLAVRPQCASGGDGSSRTGAVYVSATDIEIPAALDGERIDRALALLDRPVAEQPWRRSSRPAGCARRRPHRRLAPRARPRRAHASSSSSSVADDAAPRAVVADERVPFEVVHEDDALIVVDKPAGVVVHPGSGPPRRHARLRARSPAFPTSWRRRFREREIPSRPGIVHRLDKDTSGLLVVARTPAVLRRARRSAGGDRDDGSHLPGAGARLVRGRRRDRSTRRSAGRAGPHADGGDAERPRRRRPATGCCDRFA